MALARGSLGNPWLFAQLLGVRAAEPSRAEILAELDWVLDCAVDHLGADRAGRYLRKFYPWYVDRLGAGKPLQDGLQRRRDDRSGARFAARLLTGVSALPKSAFRTLSILMRPRGTGVHSLDLSSARFPPSRC